MDERDQYLLHINLGDLETSSGEDQHYWLLQIDAARRERALIEEEQTATKSEFAREREGILFFVAGNSLS